MRGCGSESSCCFGISATGLSLEEALLTLTLGRVCVCVCVCVHVCAYGMIMCEVVSRGKVPGTVPL